MDIPKQKENEEMRKTASKLLIYKGQKERTEAERIDGVKDETKEEKGKKWEKV